MGSRSIDDDDVDAVVRVLRVGFPDDRSRDRGVRDRLRRGVRRRARGRRSATAPRRLHCAYAAAGVTAASEVDHDAADLQRDRQHRAGAGGRPRSSPTSTVRHAVPRPREGVRPPRSAANAAFAAVDYAGHPAAHRSASWQLGAEARPRWSSKTPPTRSAPDIGDTAIGSLAHLTTFSFHPVKTITTGEGGAVLTNDAVLAERARDFRNHGLVRDAERCPARSTALVLRDPDRSASTIA